MFSYEGKDIKKDNHFMNYLGSKRFHLLLIGVVTILLAFIIVETGAAPKKYKLGIGDKSSHDITAPRDIENTFKTKQNKEMAASAVPPVMKEISSASIEVLNRTDDFFSAFETERKNIEHSLQEQEITKRDKNYRMVLENEQELAFDRITPYIKGSKIPLSDEQVRYLLYRVGEDELSNLKKVTKDLVSKTMKEDVTIENIPNKVNTLQNSIQISTAVNQEMRNIGTLIVKELIIPNRTIDDDLTRLERDKAANRPENVVKIKKDERIISYMDIVTEDKYELLKDLNLLETTSRFDYGFAAGILIMILFLFAILITYMYHFCRKILFKRGDMILLSSVIILTLIIASGVNEYNPLAIPVFMAAMLISMILDLKLAGVVNFVLTIAISFITNGNLQFFYMSLISGTISIFLVSKANQRSTLSLAGIITGAINVLIIFCIGIINKSDVRSITIDGTIVFLNGFVSMVLTLGMLPFLELTFNVITPLKLLELANPNQPLVKRLLMEAPGTYHHSLMVGNLAEVATEAIGGNSLLARVGAYFHDIGKLKRPNFFIENQLSENPHDRMTANLSTLVITSHTKDGVELAQKYKIPLAIRDIISQHHGNTLVAYFYHKAKKGEKGESVKHDNFRYEGPRPTTREAAVVMLADSVEAAVRSMIDKTEGKIEGLVRKIIRDKLDDGQLDSCNLTLKNLDDIAKSFMHVFSGLFHEREEYPEVKAPLADLKAVMADDVMADRIPDEEEVGERSAVTHDNLN